MQHSAGQVMIDGRNFKFCHHSVIGSAYPISYWGNSESDIFCHSIGPRLHDCARIPLAHHFNPTIDWVLGCIFFHQLLQPEAKTSPPVETFLLSVPLSSPEITSLETSEPSPLVNNRKPPGVTLTNASTYAHTCKLEGTQHFQLRISLPEVTSQSTSSAPVDLGALPEEYHDFADVFSKSKAGILADHQPYNLKITLDEGTVLPFGPIYSLSQEELAALHKFIDKNLATGFIRPSHSPCGAPVLLCAESQDWTGCLEYG